VRTLQRKGHRKLVLRSHAELELTDRRAVEQFFRDERPEYVFLAAARVGGILANNTYPAEFIRDNLEIHINVIHQAWGHGVKRQVSNGSGRAASGNTSTSSTAPPNTHRGPWWAIRGLYSRKGAFYAPFFPLPQVNWVDVLEWVLDR